LTALIAAYLIVLQSLLLPMVVAVGVVTDTGICSAVGPQSPASHQTGCPCAAGCGMQCCAQALAGPPQAFPTIALTRAGARMSAPPLAPIIRLAARSRQLARGPPEA
jgi:hypothetical protein